MEPDTTDITIAASGDPQYGGTVTFGIEAETDGWNPTSNRWAISGYMVGSAVFDPLAAYDADGVPQPYLAESFTPSEDFLTWTIRVRPDIEFHDGTPLDGAAVAKSLEAVRADALTGAVLANIASVAVDPADPMAVTVTMTDPWASFPAALVNQSGYVVAPAQLDAEAAESSARPIGTGPFVFEEWVPDRSWKGTRNEDYWRTDAAGNQLPYLDAVEFVPVPDNQNRYNGLLTGDLQMMHMTNWLAIDRMRTEAEAGTIQFVADQGENEESFVLLNTEKAPLDDVRVRRALALCTDRDVVFEVSGTPDDYAAETQFREGSPWFEPDNGFPATDVAAGSALIAEVEAESGPVSFSLGTTPVPENEAITGTLAALWEACGVEVELKTTEQGTFIADAVTGNYDANLWRQFGAADPDGDYLWWTSKNANPIGQLSLNMARLSDEQVDAALDAARASDDPEVRREAYSALQKRQSELVPYVWLGHSQWAVGAADDVRGIGNGTLPDGQPSARFEIGRHRLTETWLDQG